MDNNLYAANKTNSLGKSWSNRASNIAPASRRRRRRTRPSSAALNMSSFASAFLRTSRAAIRSNGQVNPVQTAWGKNGGAYMRNYATAFERTKPHVNIGMSYPCQVMHTLADTLQAPSVTSITARPPSPPPSPSVRPRRALPTSSTMPRSTRLPRSASAVSPSPPPTSSTRPRTATMPTSTAPVTPITSRT
jgi:hypothetical protein